MVSKPKNLCIQWEITCRNTIHFVQCPTELTYLESHRDLLNPSMGSCGMNTYGEEIHAFLYAPAAKRSYCPCVTKYSFHTEPIQKPTALCVCSNMEGPNCRTFCLERDKYSHSPRHTNSHQNPHVLSLSKTHRHWGVQSINQPPLPSSHVFIHTRAYFSNHTVSLQTFPLQSQHLKPH